MYLEKLWRFWDDEILTDSYKKNVEFLNLPYLTFRVIKYVLYTMNSSMLVERSRKGYEEWRVQEEASRRREKAFEDFVSILIFLFRWTEPQAFQKYISLWASDEKIDSY